MSLFSAINAADSASSHAADTVLASALQKLAAKKGTSGAIATISAPGGSGAASSSIQITPDARRAAATKADSGLDAGALAAQVHAALKASGKADFTAMSGRAVATVILNKDGSFSRAEVAAAKAELKARDRIAFMQEIATDGLSAALLAGYLNTRTAARATMSAEEIAVRAQDSRPLKS